ncbi:MULTISPECIES: ATPase [Micromonospora]|uniref:ATPase n=1 Tax=Micromonospora chalcea TaxID=1874 RepID=A0ABX9XXU8_MICCH|nr:MULTISPECIES: ATPase [Micromonospora]MBQ1069569.1 ATPase [Micromonospora sp. D75]ODB74039.1 ATPase [Micromonospora sp. II]RBQ06493.1 ATPase [Micromonospora sp. LHW51205]RQW88587.1 ATPase [Micromonospora chalcea]
MRFSVVETGYDRRQVDSCLDELSLRLGRLAARAEGAAGAGREWDQIRSDALHLCDFLHRRTAPVEGPEAARPSPAEREAAELLATARAELEAAREEARRLREEAYADALRARREFEAALLARRRRESRVDEILAGARGERVPVDTPTAAAGVRPGAGRGAA